MTRREISHSIAGPNINDVIEHRTGKTEVLRQLKCTCQTHESCK